MEKYVRTLLSKYIKYKISYVKEELNIKIELNITKYYY